MPGSLQIFTSNIDGHAARAFGRGNVRECRGSLDLWQCVRPCRWDDVWEAPPGFAFAIDVDPVTGQPFAEDGDPESRPLLHLVPMWKPACMDHALSVADAFRDNYPRCRSCLGLARPSVAGAGDLHWVAAGPLQERYRRWRHALKQLVTEQLETKVVILEIGKASANFH